MTLYYDRFDTPIGPLTVAVDDNGVRHILFAENRHDAKGREQWQRDPDAVAEPRRQLLEYLQGKRRQFDLILAPAGTDFQLDVWQMLAKIPFGATWSYRELANVSASPPPPAPSVPPTAATRSPSCCPATG